MLDATKNNPAAMFQDPDILSGATAPSAFPTPSTSGAPPSPSPTYVPPSTSVTPSASPIPKSPDATPSVTFGYSPSATVTPSVTATITAATTPYPPPPKERVLIPLQLVEGFGAYPDGIMEMFHLAKRTNRWLVEPCIRNACIEPCRCGLVLDDIPPFDQARADRGEDPLALPALPAQCKLYMTQYWNYNGTDPMQYAYPIRALFDIDDLKRTIWPHVIPYNQWCKEYAKTAKPLVHPDGKFANFGIWEEEKGYYFDFGVNRYDVPIGDFWFRNAIHGRTPDVLSGLKVLMEDPADRVFLWFWYRGPVLSPVDYTPKLNPWHEAAINRWIKDKFEGDKYVTFQWRHEFAEPPKVPWCADHLIRAAKVLPEVNPQKSRTALLIDMPPPGQKLHFWVDNFQDDNAHHVKTQTVVRFIEEGFRFYDAENPNIESSILAARDYLIARKADLYIHCAAYSSNVCFYCTKGGSNYISRIERDRRIDGKGTFTQWYSLPNMTDVHLKPRISPQGWEPIATGWETAGSPVPAP